MAKKESAGYTVQKEKSLLTGEEKWIARFNGERLGSGGTKAQAMGDAKWHQKRQAQVKAA